jgi:hypothetical protein
MSFRRGRRPAYLNKDVEVSTKRGDMVVRRALPTAKPDVSDLVALAAAAQVPVRKIEAGERTLTPSQMYVAVHAPDDYQHACRHFVGELQARVGFRDPRPVEPRPRVEKTDDEREAERFVWRRRDWGRRWARKRRQD